MTPGGLFVEDFRGRSLRDYWRLFGKYKWLIATFFFGTVIAAAIATLLMTPIYTAETTLLIEPKDPDIVNIKQVLPESLTLGEYDYYKTQFQILMSRSLIAQVIQEQGLEKNSAFTRQSKKEGLIQELWANWISQPVAALRATVTAAVKEWANWLFGQVPKAHGGNVVGLNSQLIDAYQGMLNIEPLKRTRLVKIAFSTPNPELSARIANAHADAYVREGFKLRTQASQEAQKFLETKLEELKERVERSEAILNNYRRQKGILSLNDKENIVVERLADLNKRLTEAEAERIGLEAQARLVKNRSYDSLPAVINSGLIQGLKGRLVTFEGEYAHLATQFKDGYPRLAQLKAQIEETRQRLAQEIRSVVEGINSAYLAAAGKERALNLQMNKQKSDALAQKDASVEYAILAREADTNNQLYNSVLARMKEIGVAAEIRASNVSIIDSAEVPRQASWPKKMRNLLLSAIVGLVGALGLAFLMEYLDNTLKNPEEVERYLSLPNLGLVPEFINGNRRLLDRAPIIRKLAEKRRGNGVPEPEMVFYPSYPHEKPHFSFPKLNGASEAYRTLRTGILLSHGDEPPKTVLFTSAVHAEGKTATVVNSAITFAQMGVKVLLIDADLHRPSCHKILGMRRGPGLAELLDGQIKSTWAIQPTHVDNLFFMSSGSAASNPTELFSSKRMRETLLLLGQLYDYVLVDSPPVMAVSDAVLLSTMTDGVVLVVGGQQTPRDIVKQACSRLHYARAKILGLVLNRIDLRKDGYFHYYDPYKPYANAEIDKDVNTHVT